MTVKAAGYVIFRELNNFREYLLLQSSREPHHWTPPKGHLDPGEDELEASLRELHEESGIHKSDIEIYSEFKKVIEYEVKNRLKTVTYYIAKLNNPNQLIKLSDEHQDYKWLPIAQACEISGYKTSCDLLLTCDEYLNKCNH